MYYILFDDIVIFIRYALKYIVYELAPQKKER